MQLTPTIAIHTTFALSALILGPMALWTRLRTVVRPRWHRAFGYTPIHILIPVTFFSLWRAFTYLAQGNYRGHQLTMQWTYALACVVTGLFTLLPKRLLGQMLFGS